jgi:hypothetical protein
MRPRFRDPPDHYQEIAAMPERRRSPWSRRYRHPHGHRAGGQYRQSRAADL